MLTDKYGSLIEMAKGLGIAGLSIEEADGVLRISGTAGNAEEVGQLRAAASGIDPDWASGELQLEVSDASSISNTTYEVKPGDTLSGIGQRYGVSWQAIFEANRDILDNPDLIKPGQELRIPGV